MTRSLSELNAEARDAELRANLCFCRGDDRGYEFWTARQNRYLKEAGNLVIKRGHQAMYGYEDRHHVE